VPNNPIVLPKACECGSQTGALGSSVGAGRFLCCAQCNKHIKAITKKELEALVSPGGESVGVPLRRRCLCGNQKGVGVQAGSQWIVRCLRCNIFSHFATEAEILRSGSSLTRSQAGFNKGTAPKAAKVTKLATALRPLVTPVPPKTTPAVALAAPVQPKATEVREPPKPKTAPVVALAVPVQAATQPNVIAAPAIESPEPVWSQAPPPKISSEWEEELLNEVSKELRLLALKRKVREVTQTLTYRLRGV
jgi:hypothetical protein